MTSDDSSLAGRGLLATKLHAPRRRPGVVQRHRLANRLAMADASSVTLVSAPAGFGKTTLLIEWLRARDDDGLATPWLSLDAGDNDPAVLWTYTIAAIQRAAPHVGAHALSSLQSSQPLTTVVASLLNDLYDLVDPIVVVLDDYHVIDSTEIHEWDLAPGPVSTRDLTRVCLGRDGQGGRSRCR
jgi:LuxR family transcriptional regulator, maltose regulon positive regulatory protein